MSHTPNTKKAAMVEYKQQEEDSITRLRGPKRYHIIMLNDNTTPMDYVVQVLIAIYNKDLETAKNLTLEVHEKGRAIVGTYSYEVAEQKCLETITDARRNGFPLDVVMEESE